MNILLIVDNQEMSTFYYYQAKEGEKRLARYSPTTSLGEIQVGQAFVQYSLSEFILLFEQKFDIEIDNYLVMQQEQLLAHIEENLMVEGKLTVNNPKAFTTSAMVFKKGKQAITFEQLQVFFTFDAALEQKEIFDRQEHILRLYKNQLLKDKNPIKLVKMFQKFKKIIQTNIHAKMIIQALSLFTESNGTKLVRTNVCE